MQTLAHVRSRHWSPCERDTLKTLLCNINRIVQHIICTEVVDTRARIDWKYLYTSFLYKIRIKAFCMLYRLVCSFFPTYFIHNSVFFFSITCYVCVSKGPIQFEYFVNSRWFINSFRVPGPAPLHLQTGNTSLGRKLDM